MFIVTSGENVNVGEQVQYIGWAKTKWNKTDLFINLSKSRSRYRTVKS